MRRDNMCPIGIIERFSDLTVDILAPRRLVEQTLETVVGLSRARSSAVFRRVGHGIELVCSVGVGPVVMETIETLWLRHSGDLGSGRLCAPNQCVPPRPHRVLDNKGAPDRLVMVPVLEGVELLGLMYVEGSQADIYSERGAARLTKASNILARVLGDIGNPQLRRFSRPGGCGRPTEGEALRWLMNRYAWNLARAARDLGVSRQSIRRRLAGHRPPRRSERSLPSTPAPAPSAS